MKNCTWKPVLLKAVFISMKKTISKIIKPTSQMHMWNSAEGWLCVTLQIILNSISIFLFIRLIFRHTFNTSPDVLNQNKWQKPCTLVDKYFRLVILLNGLAQIIAATAVLIASSASRDREKGPSQEKDPNTHLDWKSLLTLQIITRNVNIFLQH